MTPGTLGLADLHLNHMGAVQMELKCPVKLTFFEHLFAETSFPCQGYLDG